MIPFEIPIKSRLVVLPDVHRDLAKATAILRHCNIIDSLDNWICYDTIVVQMGDQIDGANRSGDPPSTHDHGKATSEDVGVLKFFDGLSTQAQEKNSLMISLIGNHEVMNVGAIFPYADLGNCPVCTRAREAIFRPGSQLCRSLASTRHCVLKIGPFLLSHAGVTRDHLARVNGDLSMYNRYLQSLLLGEGKRVGLMNSLIGENGFLSHRSYHPSNITPETMEGLHEVLRATRTSHMITGHNTTPGMVPIFGNKNELIVFDPGMSKSVSDQKASALDIRNGEIYVVKTP